ncbi:haloacid dehalogenase-like hydrolase, partial [Kineococcus sp. SYSU DK003]|uniref:haloacid dehalogenase-like hydrolase n=1 Tax=Kineococcus sp. SYSU DK003 TaxID=3383124 RepID=UPI003D7EEC46
VRRRPSGRRRTVVFDLDGTLVAGDSFGRFLTASWRRAPHRLLAGAALWLLPGPRTRAELLVIGATTFGLTAGGLRRRWHQHARHHGRSRIEVALRRLEEHRRAGDRVVVATACAEPLARLVCAELGLHDVDLVASPYEHRRWLPPRATAIRGEVKVGALRRAGIELPVDDAYSDSLRDLPLLRAARTAHLVRPRARELARLRAALGDVEVLD